MITVFILNIELLCQFIVLFFIVFFPHMVNWSLLWAFTNKILNRTCIIIYIARLEKELEKEKQQHTVANQQLSDMYKFVGKKVLVLKYFLR